MKDINFFSIYTKRKSGATYKALIALLIIGGIGLFIGGTYFALTYYLNGIKNETKSIDAYLQSDAVKNTVDAVEVYKSNEAILKQYGGLVEEVLVNLKASDYINSTRLDEISAALPVDVVMTSLEVTDNTATFVYTVSDMALSAQLIDALAQVQSIESVSLSDITAEETGGYAVTLTAVLKGGAEE